MAGVFWTRAAARDLARVQAWLTQRGSGERAHATVERILAATDALATTALQYTEDPARRDRRRMIVGRHIVRFRVVTKGDKPTLVAIERIFGPGQAT